MSIGIIKVHGGNFKGAVVTRAGVFSSRKVLKLSTNGLGYTAHELSDIASVTVESRQTGTSFVGGAVGGMVGGMAFGGVGMLAGVAAGGLQSEVTFVLRLKDGRSFLGTARQSLFMELQSACKQF